MIEEDPIKEPTSEYRSDLEIDQLDLLWGWGQQAPLYDKWGRVWVIAEHKVNRTKSRRKLRKAQVAKAVRDNPTQYGWNEGGKSPSLGFIDECIRLDKEFQSIDKEYNQARFEAGAMEVAKDSFLHRRKGLEFLSQLYMRNYEYRDEPAPGIRTVMEESASIAHSEELNKSERLKELSKGNKGND
jgi:hypothetical protein